MRKLIAFVVLGLAVAGCYQPEPFVPPGDPTAPDPGTPEWESVCNRPDPPPGCNLPPAP